MPNTRRFQQLPRTPVSEAGSSPASTPASGQGSSGLVSHYYGICIGRQWPFSKSNCAYCLGWR
jgi:hypothetical protein